MSGTILDFSNGKTNRLDASELLDVLLAMKDGDFSKQMPQGKTGIAGKISETLNDIVRTNSRYTAELEKAATMVAERGDTSYRMSDDGYYGEWSKRVEAANNLLDGVTLPMKELSRVVDAIREGDLSQSMAHEGDGRPLTGDYLQTALSINKMIADLNTLIEESMRIMQEVSTAGKLSRNADVGDASGVWKDLVGSINYMANVRSRQTQDVKHVLAAVARGDLSQRITVAAEGEIEEVKNIVNAMMDRLNSFAGEIARVTSEVGTEGKLGVRADVGDATGAWKATADSVNSMIGSLTNQMRDILKVASAVANGDLSTKITVDVRGEILELKNAINAMVDRLGMVSSEITRVTREVGTEGRLGGQAYIANIGGTWLDLTDSVNVMVKNLTSQMRDISKVAIAVADGDLSTKITVNAHGEILELKNAVNGMVDQLGTFASEVTRVAREVGTEGKLGAQAQVNGADGVWSDLTNSVNTMAANITRQVRDVARVVTAIAKGNLKKKMSVDSEGEFAELTETIDNMIDTLASFAEQVSSVAHEVGVEGKLGGQASVPGASGIWAGLTDNVNQLAKNLTTQVRAINAVATAVAKGDLSHSITVEAVGEVAVLKDNVNEMTAALRDTTKKNAEQDWLNTNLARLNRMLQGQRDLPYVCKMILTELASTVNVQHGALYVIEEEEDEQALKLYASYGFQERKHLANRFRPGEGLLGQCMLEKQRILLTDVPGDYVRINSALGSAAPMNIVIIPILFENTVLAVVELASFSPFTGMYLEFMDQLAESIGIVINTIRVNSRTEELLKQSQSLTEELQQQQEELTQTNEELEEKAKLLVDQNAEVEQKNDEIEQSRHILEEKAEQLAITSKYKSEFLANMSHELRTPLNSLLVLAQQLSDNPDGNLTEKQVEFSHIIFESGNDLLSLINDILDLSKIESGTVTPNITSVEIADIRQAMERVFRQIAENKGLKYEILIAPGTPGSIVTDRQRVAQVLKNLLSNAFKFTSEGSVTLRIGPAEKGWTPGVASLDSADTVLALEVKDTGIGIPASKQKVIFEAFQQADGSTNRKYGGTGLGLAISREIAQILGGEIRVSSTEGEGSTFTLYLPCTMDAAEPEPEAEGKKAPAETAGSRSLPEKPARRKKAASAVADDRDDVRPGDNVLLIIEDDPKFTGILAEMAQSKGLKTVVTLKGGDAIDLAHQYMPSAIILDLRLPDVDGWTILERLRGDIEIRHIPVHIISAEDERLRGLQRGALTYLNKPVSNKDLEKTFDSIKTHLNVSVQSLLILSANHKMWDAKKVLGGIDVKIITRSSGENALALLRKQPVDCIILDTNLSDMSAVQFVAKLQEDPPLSEIPVIVYAKDELEKDDQAKLDSLAERAVVREVQSSDRLLDEATLFLHKVVGTLPDTKKSIIQKIYQSDDILRDKKILIVDDDMRNIFALTSVLERHSVAVLAAESGKEAIDSLQANPDVKIVLMDIMMPDMDGYETTRRIRRMPQYRDLPIVALTAKAMKGDREKCIEAGASDYITKPIDTTQLLSLLRVWLYK